MSDLRVFTYLPNPRIWKSIIAARLAGVALDVRGAKPRELPLWLWDFEPRPLSEVGEAERRAAERKARTGFSGTLHKTDAFLRANPTGSVPCAFSPDGRIGIFESNSIMRAVARLGQPGHGLYGNSALESARIDGFLDISLVFARDSQRYLLAIGGRQLDAVVHEQAGSGYHAYLGALEQALTHSEHLCGDTLTLADIAFACEFALFARERKAADYLNELGLPVISDLTPYPRAAALVERLCAHPAFRPELEGAIPELTS